MQLDDYIQNLTEQFLDVILPLMLGKRAVNLVGIYLKLRQQMVERNQECLRGVMGYNDQKI